MTVSISTALFDRVVCGVDRSEAGLIAARAAALVAEPDGSLTVVAASDSSIAVQTGWNMGQVRDELAADAAAALEQAVAVARPLHSVEDKLVQGDPLHVLLAEVERREATTVVVGSHGHARATGIALGSVATHLLHEAPCAVLVARGNVLAGRWPRRVFVGIDGSEHSAQAYRVGAELSARLDADLHALVATHDRGVDLDAARRIAPDAEERYARPLDLLSVVSGHSDLIVVGSRGLRGVRAVGSLSERLAHETLSSVLVVRSRE